MNNAAKTNISRQHQHRLMQPLLQASFSAKQLHSREHSEKSNSRRGIVNSHQQSIYYGGGPKVVSTGQSTDECLSNTNKVQYMNQMMMEH